LYTTPSPFTYPHVLFPRPPTSDSDDDVPLSNLASASNGGETKSAAADSDDDKPLSVLSAAGGSGGSAPARDDSDSDDSDDMPLSAVLKGMAKAAPAKKKAAVKKKAAPKKKATPKKKAPAKAKAPAKRKAPPKAAASPAAKKGKAGAATTDKQDNSRLLFTGYGTRAIPASAADPKKLLVAAVVCRWWYCMDWPPTELKAISEKKPKKFYMKVRA